MAKFHNLFTFAVLFISTISVHVIAENFLFGQENGGSWEDGHATFYGDMGGGETMQGACGYGDLFQQGYGFETAALSTALFNKGQTCGACFEIIVPCAKGGGIKFEIKGNPHWITVTPINVGGAGDVTALAVKGSKSGQWVPMSRNWGQVWQTSANLVGQSLSFYITTSDRKMAVLYNVAPANWQFGQTYEGKANI
ncbi:hypothetical protein ACLB2K_067758 [Fragaria x ananassa]